MSLFPLPTEGARRYEQGGAELVLHPCFLSERRAGELFEALLDLPGWRCDEIRIFGRMRSIPRLHRWFAIDRQVYCWSGLTMNPEPFPPCLEPVRRRASRAAGVELNTGLGNLYRDGRDSVAWHADDEPELGPRPVIASLSLGAERRFTLRRRDDPGQRVSLSLPPGSLLVMAGETQRWWEHCLPKTKRAVGPRINVTFRCIVR